MSPVMHATLRGHRDVVQELIPGGADPNVQNEVSPNS